MGRRGARVLLYGNSDWYLYNFRLSLASALRDADYDVLLVSPPGPFGEELSRLGFRWVTAPMSRRSLNPFREARLVLWLIKLMLNEKIDVVHGFTIKCAVYGSLAAKLAGVPARVNAITGMGYVFTSGDLLAKGLRGPVRALVRLALSGSNCRVILQNRDDVELVRFERLANPENIRLIAGSGVDCQRFLPRKRRRTGGSFRVVLPARLLWDKGVSEFLEAARILRAEGCDIEFLLAGAPDPGNPSSVSELQLAEWEGCGLVTRLGHVADMPSLFHGVDAAVLPSYREGLPRGLIEAAASGLPIIATDVPGCRDVVTNEIDGLLVPPQDGVALAHAIRRLYGCRELCARLGAAARAKALRLFDERLIISQTIAVYRELLHESPQ